MKHLPYTVKRLRSRYICGQMLEVFTAVSRCITVLRDDGTASSVTMQNLSNDSLTVLTHDQIAILTAQAGKTTPAFSNALLCDVAPHTVMCNIMHEPTEAVVIEGLPRVWHEKRSIARTQHHNTALTAYTACVLPCGHLFHPSALCLHFCTRSQQCPVCRQGLLERLEVASLPTASLRNAFACKLEALDVTDSDSDDDDNVVEMEVDLSTFTMQPDVDLLLRCTLRDVTQADGRVPNNTVTLSSRLIELPNSSARTESQQTSDGSNAEHWRACPHYILQRSFQRRFNMAMQNIKKSHIPYKTNLNSSNYHKVEASFEIVNVLSGDVLCVSSGNLQLDVYGNVFVMNIHDTQAGCVNVYNNALCVGSELFEVQVFIDKAVLQRTQALLVFEWYTSLWS